ncbi:MAG: TrkH family potassium uptake protein [Flavobacteriales bacterium]|nr:TrkH family potassium uptake protein [Flavobacteriales bacterium]
MWLNYRIVLKILSLLWLINGLLMLFPTLYSIYHGDEAMMAFLYSTAANLTIGGSLFFVFKSASGKDLKKREGFVVVTLGWLALSFTGSLPYVIGGAIPEFANAFFETMSGYTTTGATILDDIESLPNSILLWRSITQWIGGMGMIVLAIAILPILGFGSMRLFSAEAPGISPDKITPRIADTAKRLWLLYVLLTVLECILLKFAGMGLFDAVNHSLTTISTAGFSTKQASIGHFDSAAIQYIITFFMIIGGTSFILVYTAATGRVKNIFKNEEWRFYAAILSSFTVFVGLSLFIFHDTSAELAFRKALFQVVSIVTTTGYTTADYSLWGHTNLMIIFMLMFVGGSAGSTSGGVKVIRHLILVKNSFTELRRQMHTNAVIPVRLNGKALSSNVTATVLAFIMIYVLVFVVASIFLSATGLNFETAIGAVAACLGNVGPGIADVGPSNSYSGLSSIAKWALCFLMLLGRLELFTIMVLFTPYFWVKR